ncbi:MAG TPA: MBL fold metallo-hydrolase [Acetobacteraceae bacterium]|nr:MBL fold metallo-hydrolase [Acetobacteraceae bacterium]
MTHANPGIHHVQVGDVLVTALNDGQFDASTSLVVGVPGEECDRLLRDSFRVLPPRITVSCFLLRFGGRQVLVDAGGGAAWGNVLGHAAQRLAALGIPAASIDAVLVTHAHVDHVNGLLDADGRPAYPNAEIIINGVETGFWLSEENEARAPEAAKDAFATAKRALTPYRERIRTVTDGAEALPGITARHLPGHTPGHSGWLIASGRESLLIWGDVVHLPGIQFARPEAGMVFDTDADQARRTRAGALEMVAAERMLLAGMHLDFPAFGHVARHGSGYWFEPMVWAPTEAGPFAAG